MASSNIGHVTLSTRHLHFLTQMTWSSIHRILNNSVINKLLNPLDAKSGYSGLWKQWSSLMCSFTKPSHVSAWEKSPHCEWLLGEKTCNWEVINEGHRDFWKHYERYTFNLGSVQAQCFCTHHHMVWSWLICPNICMKYIYIQFYPFITKTPENTKVFTL